MAPSRKTPPNLPCPAWVYSPTSTVQYGPLPPSRVLTNYRLSVAKDRSWFGDDYVVFRSSIDYATPNETFVAGVIGVGSVLLKTKRFAAKGGKNCHGEILLKNVVHAPASICNIIGQNISDDYEVDTNSPGKASAGTIKDKDGNQVAHFKPPFGKSSLLLVGLSGPPIGLEVGPSPLEAFVTYNICVSWPEEERTRFNLYEATRTGGEYIGKAPLTDEERKFLDKNYGGEEQWLTREKLSTSDEDREVGRQRLRSFRLVTPIKILLIDEDLDTDMRSPDRYFPYQELRWVIRKWKDSQGFMEAYGFRQYKPEECEKAALLATKLMEGDEEDNYNDYDYNDYDSWDDSEYDEDGDYELDYEELLELDNLADDEYCFTAPYGQAK
ncbi:hypothetical protein FDECE_16292 [Fusarium decemcellulare]|nr:hypothetical protein FDECE_16292 [Fusarium decemcellulare]